VLTVGTAVGARAAALVRSLPDHQLLDKVVRGRAWIPLLGVMLAGIVAMQVEVLKLGASIGRSIQQETTLQSANQLLRASVTGLSDDQRIEKLAATMGMVMPPPGAVAFLSPAPGAGVNRALANIHAPDAYTFGSLQSANGAVVTLASLSSPASGVTTATSTSTASSVQSTSAVSSTPASATTTSATPASATTTSTSPSAAAGPAATLPQAPASTQTVETTGGASASGG
jgi:hypothetical protein